MKQEFKFPQIFSVGIYFYRLSFPESLVLYKNLSKEERNEGGMEEMKQRRKERKDRNKEERYTITKERKKKETRKERKGTKE